MNPRSRLGAVLALALTLGLVAAGCGDDDDGDGAETGGAEPLSKQEFIAQADAICAQGDAAIDAEGERFSGQENALEALVRTVIVPMTREQVAQIRALTPPAGDEQQITEILDQLDEGLDELNADPNLVAVPDGPATILAARALAGAYGFQSCNRGGGAGQDQGEIGVGS
ncbi:MAG: hypothetical protein M3O25_07110 [Actinomycetota bacterium]|nr:hypothetical protein [Actinomycetota bacterium]